jgi:hypothetical protein
MACFIVPLTQAIATTAYRKRVENQKMLTSTPANAQTNDSFVIRNLKTLEQMLWGGSLMLVVDHIINGELTWRFPFFTALETEGGGLVMLQEMLTVGVPMSVIVTLGWAGWCYLKETQNAKLKIKN